MWLMSVLSCGVHSNRNTLSDKEMRVSDRIVVPCMKESSADPLLCSQSSLSLLSRICWSLFAFSVAACGPNCLCLLLLLLLLRAVFPVVYVYCCRLLSQVFPAADEVPRAVENNKRMWMHMNKKLQQLQRVGSNSMDIFDIEVDEASTL